MDLLLPIAGRSSRYSGELPKWALTLPSGRLMFEDVLVGLKDNKFEKKYVICVEEQILSFTTIPAVKEIVRQHSAELIVIPSFTNSQAETIKQALMSDNKIGKDGFLIKDCDNLFQFDIPLSNNFVAVQNLHKIGHTVPGNKSYVRTDEFQRVVSIEEKKIISDKFCAGGYAFQSRKLFLNALSQVERICEPNTEIYISHVIHQSLLEGIDFFAVDVNNYVDLGTHQDFSRYCETSSVLFCDIDGVLLESGGPLNTDGWNTSIIEENVEHLVNQQKSSNLIVFLVTSRGAVAAKEAADRLKKRGLVVTQVLHSLPHASKVMVSPFSKNLPYPNAKAINVQADSQDLKDVLR